MEEEKIDEIDHKLELIQQKIERKNKIDISLATALLLMLFIIFLSFLLYIY